MRKTPQLRLDVQWNVLVQHLIMYFIYVYAAEINHLSLAIYSIV